MDRRVRLAGRSWLRLRDLALPSIGAGSLASAMWSVASGKGSLILVSAKAGFNLGLRSC